MPKLPSAVDPIFVAFQIALAGRYSIDRELGRGGMGIVFLAREVHLDRLVAIKLLPPDRASDPLLRERFLREARLAAKLSHPNIIPIHAVDDAAGFVFYVMAYVEGETLTQRVRTRGPLPPSEGARVLREVAWALAHAHAQGLVHRDVKPDNILLEAASGRVLVADFGIAAIVGDVGGVGLAGTPEFMSPEQALGGPVDGRSDLYALGATAYFACSGRLPFEGRSATEVLAKQVTEPAPSLAASVPRKLALIIDRCLSKEPAQRPPSAESLADQLGLALEQRRELPAALRAFVKRNGRMDGGGTMIAGVSMIVGSVTLASLFGPAAGLEGFVGGMVVFPLAYMVNAARRLSRLGFAHADLGPAFRGEIEQAKEEHAVEHGRGPTLVERGLRALAILAWPVAFAAALASIWTIGVVDPTLFRWLSRLAAYAFPTAIMSSFGHLALLQHRRDIDTEFWMRLWMGRIGRTAFSLGRKLMGRGALRTAMTHRATELSLGMAAEQLYSSLPKETRKALGDLPSMLARLQEDAQRLRTQHDDLDEALSAAGAHATSASYADLRSIRDQSRARLSDAVGALETIRLNLLRLHAGSATVESLTTHLGLAAEVSADVQRLVEAHEAVEHMLKTRPETVATDA